MLSRRQLLKGAAALLLVRDALAQGRMEKGIYRVRGDVRVNGEPAKEGAQVRAGDAIASGADGEMAFVVNRDAMLMRRNANVSLLGASRPSSARAIGPIRKTAESPKDNYWVDGRMPSLS